MTAGLLFKQFLEAGGVEVEGNLETATDVSNAVQNIQAAPPSPGSGGAGGPQF